MKSPIVSIALAAQMHFFASPAKAEPPPCGDPAVLQGLHDAGNDLVSPSTKPTDNAFVDKIDAVLIPNGEFDTRVTEMFTISRSEDERECQATMHLIEPGRIDGTTSIFYTVVRTEDGKTIYAVKNEQSLAATMFRSLEANNNLTEETDEIRRDLLRSASIKPQMDQLMRSNPDINKPAPSYPPSNFGHRGDH